MDDNCASQHALGPDQLNHVIGDVAFCVALAIGLEVAEIADVTLAVAGGAVGLGKGVDCCRRLVSDDIGREAGWGSVQ